MPAKDTRKLTDTQRAEIVLAKELRVNGTDTDGKLAQNFQVAEITIKKHNYEMLSDAQKEIYEQKKASLKFDALNLTHSALIKSQELVERADSTKDLAGVVAAGKFGYEAHRLETNQPTQITQSNPEQSKLDRFIATFLEMEKDGERPTMEMALTVLSGVDLDGVGREARDRYIEGERKKLQIGT